MSFKILLVVILLISGNSRQLFSQPLEFDQVPPLIMDEFTLVYPDAKNVTWQFSGLLYVAVFRNNKMETMAIMTSDGQMVKTETEIKTSALPEEALHYLDSIAAAPKISWASIREDQAGIITFEAIVDKTSYTFDAAGQVMSFVPKTEKLLNRP